VRDTARAYERDVEGRGQGLAIPVELHALELRVVLELLEKPPEVFILADDADLDGWRSGSRHGGLLDGLMPNGLA
jgi:hypothetical protein